MGMWQEVSEIANDTKNNEEEIIKNGVGIANMYWIKDEMKNNKPYIVTLTENLEMKIIAELKHEYGVYRLGYLTKGENIFSCDRTNFVKISCKFWKFSRNFYKNRF